MINCQYDHGHSVHGTCAFRMCKDCEVKQLRWPHLYCEHGIQFSIQRTGCRTVRATPVFDDVRSHRWEGRHVACECAARDPRLDTTRVLAFTFACLVVFTGHGLGWFACFIIRIGEKNMQYLILTQLVCVLGRLGEYGVTYINESQWPTIANTTAIFCSLDPFFGNDFFCSWPFFTYNDFVTDDSNAWVFSKHYFLHTDIKGNSNSLFVCLWSNVVDTVSLYAKRIDYAGPERPGGSRGRHMYCICNVKVYL